MLGMTVPQRRSFLLRHHIAAWDVTKSCDITGSANSSIKNVTANDLSIILNSADIKAIFVNSKTAERMYIKYIDKDIGRPCIYLPSTSLANAAWSLERLV